MVAGVALALALAGLFPVGNSDTFGHLAAGRQIAEQREVPKTDGFSFWKETPQPWNNYEWLGDLAFWGAFSMGGYNGLLALKLGLLALLSVFLLWRAWFHRGSLGAGLCGLLVIWAIPAVRFRLTVRPHLFGMVFAALYLVGLPRVASSEQAGQAAANARRWTLVLTLAHLVWVNLHGSNLLGLVLTGIHLLAYLRQRVAARRLAVLLALQAAVSCISPFGPAILTDAIRHVADPAYRQLVEEWAPWRSQDPVWFLAAPAIQTLLVLLMVPRVSRRGPQAWASLGTVLLFAIMAFRSVRFVGEFMLLSAPLVAEGLSERVSGWPRRRLGAMSVAFGAAAFIFAPVMAARLPPLMPVGFGHTARNLPAGSAAWLAANMPRPRILAAMEDAWYLMYALPSAKFLMDGRVPFYGPAHTRLVIRAFDSPSLLKQVLDRFAVDTVVARHVYQRHRVLLETLAGMPTWRLAMIEDRYATFVRAGVDSASPPGTRPRAAQSLVTLRPSYEPGFVLDDRADTQSIGRELKALCSYPNTVAYCSWVEGLLSLRPLAREQARAGIRMPETAAERTAVRNALTKLRKASRQVTDVPTISAYRAMAAIAACELKEGAQAIREAAREEDSRETLFLSQELALRQGELKGVRAFLRGADALDEARHDPWLKAISHMLDSPPRCR